MAMTEQFVESAETATDAGIRQILSAADSAGGVMLPVPLSQVVRTAREGDSLVVVLEDGRELAIEGFFAVDGAVLIARDGAVDGVVALELSPEGEVTGAEPVARGRLDEMFGAEAASTADGGEAVVPALSTQGLSSYDKIVIGVMAGFFGGLAYLATDDDDDYSTGPSAQMEDPPEDMMGTPEDPPEDMMGTQEDPPEDMMGTQEDPPEDMMGTQEEFDDNNNGTAERVEIDTNADGTVDETRFDPDEDGTVERTEMGPGGGAPPTGVVLHVAAWDLGDYMDAGVPSETPLGMRDVDAVRQLVTALDQTARESLTVEQVGNLVVVGRWVYADSADVSIFTVALEDRSGTMVFTMDLDTDGNGTTDRGLEITVDDDYVIQEVRVDEEPSATFAADSIRSYAWSDADSNGTDETVAVEIDSDADGTAGRREVHTRDETSYKVTMTAFDDEFDGTNYAADRILSFSYNADGQLTNRDLDNDADGSPEIRTEIVYAANGARSMVTTTNDFDADGTADGTVNSVERDTYDSSGRLMTRETDRDYDGVMFEADLTETYSYSDADSNGTVDTVTVDFDGDSETDMDGTANRREVRTVDEADNDRVTRTEFDDEFDGTTFEADRYHRFMYNSDGQLTNRDYDNDADGTWDVQTEFVYDPASGDLSMSTTTSERTYTRDGSELSEEVDPPGEAPARPRPVEPGGTPQPEEVTESTWVRETYDSSGRVETRETDGDYDGVTPDVDLVETISYDASGRVSMREFDNDVAVSDGGDGTIDGSIDRTEQYVYLEDSRAIFYSLYDDDADDVPDRLDFHSNFNGMELKLLDSTDTAASIGHDDDSLDGITDITMPITLALELTISDAALTALADGDGDGTADADYELIIRGDADDVLNLGPGITDTGTVRPVSPSTLPLSLDGTPISNYVGSDGDPVEYQVWQGTDGLILVDPDITVN